ncbi:unnamed protein product [Ceratitis capitata]|uniref:(Mediterranean fruit fly) hypothetical protein n=1 Tax=Ceratitis capitata TaxID=7213 RepID=A0A811VMD3_CERCA|nr:unnamed protein product [Ceratitis capitata]
MADGEDIENSMDKQLNENDGGKPEKMFTLKKWNAVAMWSWDVECDTCAICRVQVMVVFLSASIYDIHVHPYEDLRKLNGIGYQKNMQSQQYL